MGNGSYSLLGPMNSKPYALGERPGPSTVPTIPLMSGQEAFDSLEGYYRGGNRMDSLLNPSTNKMTGGPRGTNMLHTKIAELYKLAGGGKRRRPQPLPAKLPGFGVSGKVPPLVDTAAGGTRPLPKRVWPPDPDVVLPNKAVPTGGPLSQGTPSVPKPMPTDPSKLDGAGIFHKSSPPPAPPAPPVPPPLPPMPFLDGSGVFSPQQSPLLPRSSATLMDLVKRRAAKFVDDHKLLTGAAIATPIAAAAVPAGHAVANAADSFKPGQPGATAVEDTATQLKDFGTGLVDKGTTAANDWAAKGTNFLKGLLPAAKPPLPPYQPPAPPPTNYPKPGAGSDFMSNHGGKLIGGLGLAGLAALAYNRMNQQPAEDNNEEIVAEPKKKRRKKAASMKEFAELHPMVAGFLVRCSDEDFNDQQIAYAIKQASALDPRIKLGFEKAGLASGDFKSLPFGGGQSSGGGASASFKPPTPPGPGLRDNLRQGATNAGNVFSGGLTMLGGGLGYAGGLAGSGVSRIADSTGLTDWTPAADSFTNGMQDRVNSGAVNVASGFSPAATGQATLSPEDVAKSWPKETSTGQPVQTNEQMFATDQRNLHEMSPNDSLLNMDGSTAAGVTNYARKGSETAAELALSLGGPGAVGAAGKGGAAFSAMSAAEKAKAIATSQFARGPLYSAVSKIPGIGPKVATWLSSAGNLAVASPTLYGGAGSPGELAYGAIDAVKTGDPLKMVPAYAEGATHPDKATTVPYLQDGELRQTLHDGRQVPMEQVGDDGRGPAPGKAPTPQLAQAPAQPNPAQPNPAQPNPAQPNPAQPNPAQPNPAQPNPAQPNPAQPNPAQPNPAQPNPAQPNPAQPNPAQPNPAQPNPAQPNPAQVAMKTDEAKQLVQTQPQQAQQYLDQAKSYVTEKFAPLKQQVEGWLPELSANKTPVELAKANADKLSKTFGEQTTDIVKNMEPWQHVAVWGGLGLGAIGIISAMTDEEGGIGGWLMALLGLGGAALGAGHAGLLGAGAQGMAKDVTGPASKMMGSGFAKMPDSAMQMTMRGLPSMSPELAAKLDQAAGIGDGTMFGGLKNFGLSLAGQLTGEVTRGMGEYGIPPDQVPRVLENWRKARKAG